MRLPSLSVEEWREWWATVVIGFVALDLVARHWPGATFSETSRASWRFDPVGKYPYLAALTWLVWHLGMRRQHGTAWGRGDVIAIGVGLLWALLDTLTPGGL
jgi:hypothetical protein